MYARKSYPGASLRVKKSAALCLGMVFTLTSSSTVATDWDWVVSAEADAVARCVTTDNEGNLYVVGSFRGELVLDTVVLSAVNLTSDAFLLKLAPDGQAIWGRSAGGERLDRCWGVAWDPRGHVYIAGEFCSNTITLDTITLENNFQSPYYDVSSFDVFTACYTADGNIVWARKAGGLWDDHSTGIALDTEGNVYAIGTFFSSEITFDTVSLANSGNIDLFLASYASDGQIRWARNALGVGQENAWSLAIDSAGMVYVAGSYRSPVLVFDGHVLTNTSDDFDLYVTKFSPTGRVLWARSAVGREWDDAKALALDRDDNVYMAGNFRSDTLSFESTQLVLSGTARPNIDMFLVRLDGEGHLSWAVSSAGAAWPYPSAACVWNTERIAVVGTFTGCNFGDTEFFGSSSITSHGSYDIFLVDYDVIGNSLDAENFGGEGMDFGQAACADRDGNLFMGAYFDSDSLVIGTVTLVNEHYNKMFVAKRLNPEVTPVIVNHRETRSPADPVVLLSTPNPFNTRTQISYELNLAGQVWLGVFDLSGRLVRTLVDGTQVQGPHAVIWDGRDSRFNEVATGVYLFRLKSDRGEGVGKSILVK